MHLENLTLLNILLKTNLLLNFRDKYRNDPAINTRNPYFEGTLVICLIRGFINEDQRPNEMSNYKLLKTEGTPKLNHQGFWFLNLIIHRNSDMKQCKHEHLSDG